MTIQSYDTLDERVGVWRARMLDSAVPEICLGTIGTNEEWKRNKGKTAKYRRYLEKGATAAQPNRFFQDAAGDRSASYANSHLTSEGVTPDAESVSAQDITVTVQQYSVLYGYTDQTFDFYEDDIPEVMTEKAGRRVGLVNESVLFGVLKGCTNKFYGGTGTSRATVNGAISLNGLRKIARSMRNNHAKTVRRMESGIDANGNVGTTPVGVCYPVFIHTDLCPDVEDLPNFTPVHEYPSDRQAVDNEIGACVPFRFIASPELVSVQNSGAAVAGTVPLLSSTGGTYADVYQVIVGSKEAWGHLGMNLGKGSVKGSPPSKTDKSDQLGQRGYVGAKWYYHAVVLNDLQMAVYEVGTRDLS
ncbi:MAG: N4-gp56 family major capsid protein [Burkholderiales bacterium]|nr:N4-gp56 family major capsid protein [Burkholderiales bacterium]